MAEYDYVFHFKEKGAKRWKQIRRDTWLNLMKTLLNLKIGKIDFGQKTEDYPVITIMRRSK